MTESRPENAEYGLVMPFVVCRPDGPYDATAFVAGWECGALEAKLANIVGIGIVTVQRYVHTHVVPQLYLIAMKHRFKVTVEPWDEHPDEWCLVTITNAPDY
jgi:hypothetical protein